jgi:hypothetical protein
MASCITQDLKTMLLSMIDKKMAHPTMHEVVDGLFPTCESLGIRTGQAATEAHKEAARSMAPRWPAAIYYDAQGKTSNWDSPSALFESEIGGSPSKQVVCEVPAPGQEPKCSPASMVQSFQIHGFIVRGNGEPPPSFKEGMSMAAKVALHNDWKERLKTEGKHFVVYHPKAPQLKELDK